MNSTLDKGFYAGIVDNSKSMMLYFFQWKGWIDANKTFFERMKYKGIDEFISQNDSVRDLFLANIGYEFRTLVNGILGFIELFT